VGALQVAAAEGDLTGVAGERVGRGGGGRHGWYRFVCRACRELVRMYRRGCGVQVIRKSVAKEGSVWVIRILVTQISVV
jgi:hypothetical protein